MTSKEKALELCNKFLRTYKIALYPPFNKASDEAKECALIAVDEVLKYSIAHGFIGLSEYYQEVIDEIKKL
jgi:hypothetical protein